MRSPGEEAPKISVHSVHSIFRDPIFDHRLSIKRAKGQQRQVLLKKVKKGMEERNKELMNSEKFRHFYHTADFDQFGFFAVRSPRSRQKSPPKSVY